MAKDNDKGLYLPLKIDLAEWEKSLLAADADLQKAMREMHSATSDLKLRYDVEIVNAKAAGNDVKVLELENARLNAIYNAQKASVNALNRAYQQSVKEKGADAEATKKLAAQLVRESRAMERTQAQIESKAVNVGRAISNSLAGISPEYARIRDAVAGVSSKVAGLGGVATKAATALSGIGLAAAGIGVVYTGLEKITTAVNDIAITGKNASDPIYQLRESLQSTYEDAEYLFGVTAIDGSNAESLANTLVKLDSVLLKDSDGTSTAALALQKYGAELFDANGKAKSYKEQLRELAKAAQAAAAAGEYADFKAALPGALRSTEFDHLLLGLENYEKKSLRGAENTKILYDKLHELSDAENQVAESMRIVEAVRGGFYADSSLKNMQNEVDMNMAIAKVMTKNGKVYEQTAEQLGIITDGYTKLKGVATIALENIKKDLLDNVAALGKYAEKIEPIVKRMPGSWAFSYVTSKIKPYLDNAKKDLESELEKAKKERESKEAEKSKSSSGGDATTAKQKLKAEEKFYAELRDLQSSEYEREIRKIEEERQAWINAKISEADANQMYNLKKEQIDKKYFDKLNAEREKSTKAAMDAYKREAEEAKRLREANISDAENTLRNNLKLSRYIEAQRKQGTYNEADARKYAEKLYMRQSGIRESDIKNLQIIGVDALKDIANARERLFGNFADVTAPAAAGPAITNNNNITVNLDNIVVDSMGTIDRISNAVATNINAGIQRTFRMQEFNI